MRSTTGRKTESAYFYSRAFRFATHYPVRFRFYPRLSPFVPLGVGFSCPIPRLREGFPKGRAAARPFVSFQGGAGGNRNPPAFLFRGPGGHSLFKREYPPGFSVPNRYSSAGNPGNLFGKTKRKWGFNPVRHRRTSSHQSGALGISKKCGGIPTGKTCIPCSGPPHPGRNCSLAGRNELRKNTTLLWMK